MAVLRGKLIGELEKMPGIYVHLWKPDGDYMVVDFNGKEVAHFHGNNELDVRFSPEVVRRDNLKHAANRVGHSNRKDGGTWPVVRFTRESHLANTDCSRLTQLPLGLGLTWSIFDYSERC